jgi:hypothetical protein
MLGGSVRQVGKITAAQEEIIRLIQSAAPTVSTLEAKAALERAVWSNGPTWMGGHQIAVEVLEVSEQGVPVQHTRPMWPCEARQNMVWDDYKGWHHVAVEA